MTSKKTASSAKELTGRVFCLIRLMGMSVSSKAENAKCADVAGVTLGILIFHIKFYNYEQTRRI